MNCLLLLMILFCCNNNENYGSVNCGRRDFHVRNCNSKNSCMVQRDRNCSTGNRCTSNIGSREGNGDERSNNVIRVDCDCDISQNVNSGPMPRTQFPYLDVEPRTCGCEETSNN